MFIMNDILKKIHLPAIFVTSYIRDSPTHKDGFSFDASIWSYKDTKKYLFTAKLLNQYLPKNFGLYVFWGKTNIKNRHYHIEFPEAPFRKNPVRGIELENGKFLHFGSKENLDKELDIIINQEFKKVYSWKEIILSQPAGDFQILPGNLQVGTDYYKLMAKFTKYFLPSINEFSISFLMPIFFLVYIYLSM